MLQPPRDYVGGVMSFHVLPIGDEWSRVVDYALPLSKNQKQRKDIYTYFYYGYDRLVGAFFLALYRQVDRKEINENDFGSPAEYFKALCKEKDDTVFYIGTIATRQWKIEGTKTAIRIGEPTTFKKMPGRRRSTEWTPHELGELLTRLRKAGLNIPKSHISFFEKEIPF